MARPREFNMDDALDGATRVFWNKGFHGANLPDLLKATGLTRGSFYKAFGSKRDLYLAALDRYGEIFLKPAVQKLSDKTTTSGKTRIEAHFSSLIGSSDQTSYRNGCFMCKASVDMAPHDKDVERTIKKMVRSLESGFEAALGDTNIEISNIRSQARKLTAMFLGLQVLRNAGADKSVIRDAMSSNLTKLS